MTTSVVVVAYRTPRLDLDWLPDDVPVIVVHNDEMLDPSSIPRQGVIHVHSPDNIGFGAAANKGLEIVTTDRVLFCNPDTRLAPVHWEVLTDGPPERLVTVPLVGDDGRPTSVMTRYPTATSLVLTAYRVGRLAPRGSRARSSLARLLGRWGNTYRRSLELRPGDASLRDCWVSGAVFAADVARLRDVGGFDSRFFLYLEDADLCARLARRFDDMVVEVADVPPGFHTVGGSAPSRDMRRLVELAYAESALTYARDRGGWFRLAALALVPRRWLLRRHA